MRKNDPEDGEEWRKRQIPMHPDGPALAVNGWMARLRFASLLVRDLGNGGLAVLVVLSFLAWLFGYLSIPLADRYLTRLVTDNDAIIASLGRIEASLSESRRAQARIFTLLVTSTRVSCENTARDSIARNNCMNIRE